ncbi:DUF3099 domain-containing protein [Microbacterium sp. G2-8]|uniref:DUF3099 domain-containing protein n=1 Tax=Microbacterium sp. G2-8 TaxID=2842454 RepID=UPI001C8A011F|nr:DUF3099 domain-containing protein [Microbacterium sp. G2-8]
MNRKHPAPTATSLGTSPDEDETSRMRQYLLTMGIRTACIVLAFAIQPWGWYTAVFAVGAIFLPYFAVVIANQSQSASASQAEQPELSIGPPAPAEEAPAEATPPVIRLSETPQRPEADA